MANDVKVSFVGEIDDLSKKLDRLEKDVGDTSKEIDKATKSSSGLSKGFSGLRDGAGDTERRVIGFKDSLTGTQDVMKGLKDGDLVALSMGFADLAGSVENLGADMLEWGKKAFEGAKDVVSAHAASVVAKAKDLAATVAHKAAAVASTIATNAQAAAQWALNAAMSANPIMIVVLAIAALVAGIIIAYKNSEDFRNIVDSIGRFLRDELWPAIKMVIDKVVEFGQKVAEIAGAIISTIAGIVIAFWNFVGEVRDVVAKVIDVFKDVGEKIFAPFRWAFDQIQKAWGPIKAIIDAVKGLGGAAGLGTGALSDARAKALAERGLGETTNAAGQTIIFELNGRELGQAIVEESNASGGLPIRVRPAS